MINLTSISLFFLAAGILTSVTLLGIHQAFFIIPLFYFSYQALKEKKLSLPKSSYFLLAFIFIAFLSLLLNFDYIPKPSKNFGRLRYYLLGVGSIYVLIPWLQTTSLKIKKILFNTFLVSIITAGVFATYTYCFRNIDRARGFTDTLRYGYGSSMILILLLGLLLHSDKIKSWFNFKLGFVALILGFMGMYFTYTRGALFSFITALPFVLCFYKRKLGLTLGVLALLCSLGLIGIYLFGSGNYNSRFLVNKNNPSDHVRRSQWEAAIIATKEKPILGWGFSNFHSQLKRIKESYDLNAKDYYDAHAHNLFLEVSSGTGLLGLLSFLFWITTWAYEIWIAKGKMRAIFFPFGVAWMIGSQFEMTLDANNASMIFFIYALSVSLIKISVLKDDVFR